MSAVPLKKYFDGLMSPFLVAFANAQSQITQTLTQINQLAQNAYLIQRNTSVVTVNTVTVVAPNLAQGYVQEFTVGMTTLLSFPTLPNGVAVGTMELYLTATTAGCTISLDPKITSLLASNATDGLVIGASQCYCLYLQIRNRSAAYCWTRRVS